jgi:hypothetical protein
MRVAQFIGRLGVVSPPAVEAGLDLDQRVVRRHVAKLEAAGWLARTPWVWGEGSVAWLTVAGVEAAGLGGLRAVKSPPATTTIAHGILVGWSAARVEHRGRTWKSARELALGSERWAVRMRCERGYTEQLPDLAIWLKRSAPPVAVIAESGGRREDRQKMILQGWHDAILSGRYGAVRYECANASVAHWINRLAKKVDLTAPAFVAAVQTAKPQYESRGVLAGPELHHDDGDRHDQPGERNHPARDRREDRARSVGVEPKREEGRACGRCAARPRPAPGRR